MLPDTMVMTTFRLGWVHLKFKIPLHYLQHKYHKKKIELLVHLVFKLQCKYSGPIPFRYTKVPQPKYTTDLTIIYWTGKHYVKTI